MRLACGIAAYYVLFHGIAADSFAALPLLFSRECVRGILPFVFRGIFEAFAAFVLNPGGAPKRIPSFLPSLLPRIRFSGNTALHGGNAASILAAMPHLF